MRNLRFVGSMLPLSATLFAAGVSCAQDYPSKPVRIVAGAAGGGGDFAARMVAQGIATPLGQQVIVDNRAAPILAAEFVSKAPPDGYTLYVSGNSIWITPLLQKTPYDAVRDFSPITVLVREVSVIAVHPSLPAKSVKELIALAKARPGQLNYGSAAIGSIAHLAGELFKSLAGVNIEIVQYKGGAPAITALVSGEVQLAILDPRLVLPQVKANRLRAIAVTSATPSLAAPGLPTVADSGVPGFEAIGMTSILAPAKTPAAVVNRLNQEIVRVLNLAELREKFLASGAETVGNSPEQFAATIKAEIAKWDKVIKDTGIKL